MREVSHFQGDLASLFLETDVLKACTNTRFKAEKAPKVFESVQLNFTEFNGVLIEQE